MPRTVKRQFFATINTSASGDTFSSTFTFEQQRNQPNYLAVQITDIRPTSCWVHSRYCEWDST